MTKPIYANEDDCQRYVYKLALIGDSGVGKSNMLSRFAENKFSLASEPTVGANFTGHSIRVDDKIIIRGQIWDIAGKERFQPIRQCFYKQAVGALIVYDITRIDTFENVGRWLKELRDHADQNIVVMLVGNKVDLRQSRVISTDEAKVFSESEGVLFMETSAPESLNVEKAFTEVLTQVYRKTLGIQEGQTIILELNRSIYISFFLGVNPATYY